MRLLIICLSLLIVSCKNTSKEEKEDFMDTGGEEILMPDFPDAPRWVDDSEQILTKAEKDSMNKLCETIFSETGHFPMVHTTGSFEPYNSLNDYTGAIDQVWADKSQKYLIIIVSGKLEEVRFIHGEKTEPLLHPGFVDDLMQNEMFPEFRTGNFAGGIIRTLRRYNTALGSNK